jgi:hypothetical protein
MTKSRNLGNLVKTGAVQFPSSLGTEGQTLQVNSGENGLEFADASGSGVIVYTDLSGTDGTPSGATYLLNASSPSAGDLAYVSANTSLYQNNGNGWYKIVTVNTSPTLSSPSTGTDITLAKDGTASTVTITAADVDEGTTLEYSYTVSTGSLTNGGGTTATVYGADGTTARAAGTNYTDNVFKVDPTTDSSHGGSFSLTFNATDTINTAQTIQNFSLSFSAPWGDRGLAAGGYSSALGGHNQTQIDYFDISGTASVTVSDFGDLDVGRSSAHGVSSGDRVVFAASKMTDLTGDDRKQMDYIAPATTGTASNFGDYGEIRETYGAGSNGARGIFLGNVPIYSNEMRHITIDTLGNASDYADLDTARRNAGVAYNDTYMLVGGGRVGNVSLTAGIDRVTIATTSNATDYGDLTQGRENCQGVADSSRAVFMGGYHGSGSGTNTIDYIAMGSSGSTNSATNFGNLSNSVSPWAGISNGTRGCALYANDIWMITIQTEAHSTTLGTLLASRSGAGGASGFDA